MSADNLFILGGYIGTLLFLTPVLGNYMARIFMGEPVFLSPVLAPCERLLYRICRIDPAEEMHWKRYVLSVLWFSFWGMAILILLQMFQDKLFLNPQKLSGVPLPLAFNTAVSFVTNTNWQAYSGETTLSYLTQMFGLTAQNFVSAGVGITVLVAFIRGLMQRQKPSLGNFWQDLIRSFLYVLLPLSFVLALALISQGVIQNYNSYVVAKTLEGAPQILPMGPAASQIAIKQLGTNGGGFFGVNSAHPFENPNMLSNFLEALAILLIPSALVYMFGVMINQRKGALVIYSVMLIIFGAALVISLWSEYLPNPAIHAAAALEGKELRFGRSASVLWSVATTAASNGSVNAMHDSLTPLAGGVALLLMCLGEVIFGGVGSGLYGMLMFVLLTVFISGLMIGRTPEYLGKKIETFDMQMAVIAIVLPSVVVLLGAGFSSVNPLALKSLANNGPHGLSEILYAWGSAANNNGSAFGGLNANTDFYNWALGIAMLIGRFGVIIPVLAIAGNLSLKKLSPPNAATLATDTPLFAVLLGFVVIVIGALTFFPALTLGPLAEHFLMIAGQTF